MLFFQFLWTSTSLSPEEVGHAPNCIMVEAINQSGAGIFLGVNLEEMIEIFAREMKRISILCVFLGIYEFGDLIA